MIRLRTLFVVLAAALSGVVLAQAADSGTGAAAANKGGACSLLTLSEVHSVYPSVATAKSTRGWCEYHPRGAFADVAYLTVQIVPSHGERARRFVSTGAPPGSRVGTLGGIGASAAYQEQPPDPTTGLPVSLTAMAAVKGNRVVILTFTGPVDDFPNEARGQSGFAAAAALLKKAVARM